MSLCYLATVAYNLLFIDFERNEITDKYNI